MPIGSLVNALTVIVGSTVGLVLRKKFPENIKGIIFEGVGLGTLVLGMKMAFAVEDFLIFIFSLIVFHLNFFVELEEPGGRLDDLVELLYANLESAFAKPDSFDVAKR